MWEIGVWQWNSDGDAKGKANSFVHFFNPSLFLSFLYIAEYNQYLARLEQLMELHHAEQDEREQEWLMWYIFAFHRLIDEADGEFALQPEVGNAAVRAHTRTMNTLREIKNYITANHGRNY